MQRKTAFPAATARKARARPGNTGKHLETTYQECERNFRMLVTAAGHFLTVIPHFGRSNWPRRERLHSRKEISRQLRQSSRDSAISKTNCSCRANRPNLGSWTTMCDSLRNVSFGRNPTWAISQRWCGWQTVQSAPDENRFALSRTDKIRLYWKLS